MADHLRLEGISDERVLAAIRKVPREFFVDPALREFAYEDAALPIGYDQTISQPYIVAYMTQSLTLKSEDRVLEIGTGSGYQAAVLAELVREVYSVEIIPELARSASKRLNDLGYRNVEIRQGDGYEGWAEKSPFDAIIVTGAPEKIPPKLLEQLAEGGRLIVPLGVSDQDLHLYIKTGGKVRSTKLLPVRFVPMVKGKEGESSVDK
jgi:protein-L-isoaspartate(D-aspartate) O-methyltransferase